MTRRLSLTPQMQELTMAEDNLSRDPSPCLVCRRRLRWRGRPLFTNCTCRQYGPGMTAFFLALGIMAIVAGILLGTKKSERE